MPRPSRGPAREVVHPDAAAAWLEANPGPWSESDDPLIIALGVHTGKPARMAMNMIANQKGDDWAAEWLPKVVDPDEAAGWMEENPAPWADECELTINVGVKEGLPVGQAMNEIANENGDDFAFDWLPKVGHLAAAAALRR
jgi:hypothetical protein